ncbi:unnamed protein product [Enterobius vermicularis]|uniref:Arrestin_C domain-containing protein n=1 Tax=Enterobius vermicularis TaxID=51028 RepID=A0A0N4V4P0_ENTVE|nr:unnamed protein product [Enterobius vermicularis]
MTDLDGRVGTRVFKKSSPNGKITTYLGKRDFIDDGGTVDLIDGMVLIDEDYIRENQVVTAHLLAAFRYGREDLDVLGLTFRKDLISQFFQVFPVVESEQRPLTRLQERLKKKLGNNAYPFWFQLPSRCASSVTLQPSPGDTGKPCGVDYELQTVVGYCERNDKNDRSDHTEKNERNSIGGGRRRKHNCVRLAIRKLTYSPFEDRAQPSTEMYYHGESICVNVHVQNNSNRTVKKIKVAVVQVADICLFTTASYTCEVAKVESSEGFPVGPGATLSKVYSLCPLLSNNKDKRGLALDGQLKHEDTNLASSTTFSANSTRENLGIVVQYKVKVRLVISSLGGELTAELPFTLTHPKPSEKMEALKVIFE